MAAPFWVKLVRSGTTLSGSTSPDGVTWTPVASATIAMGSDAFMGLAVTSHSNPKLSAAAFDNVAVNTAPSVAITSPTSASDFSAPATIEITASASDAEGSVSQVDFLSGGSLLGSDTTSPYAFTWNAVPAGTYSLAVRGTDNQGAARTSAPVVVTVGASALAAPWLDQDVGVVGAGGSATQAAGTFTVNGAGADIQGAADAFHFAYRPLAGDGQIVARVASQGNTNPWAKAGVMIRQNLTAGSPYVLMAVTPAHGATLQNRLTAGGTTAVVAGASVAAPYWVKIVRSGTSLVGSTSPDGVTWTPVASATIAMESDVLVGLAVRATPTSSCRRLRSTTWGTDRREASGRGFVHRGGRRRCRDGLRARDRDLELRRLGEVALDGALIDRAQQSIAISLRERRGERDVDVDARDMLSVPHRRERERQALGVEIALLAEAKRIESGAGPDRGEKEVEGRRGLAAPSLKDRLIGQDAEAVVLRLDLNAAGKPDLHEQKDVAGADGPA